MRTLVAGLAIVAVACGEPAPLPSFALDAPGDTLRVPFTEITDGAWLGGDRYAVLSPAENTVALLDFARGTTRMLDASSGELQNPSALFSLGDTLFVADWARRRVTAWNTAGGLVRSIPASDIARGSLPRAADARGRLYYELPPIAGRDGSGNRDSTAVLRAASPSAVADTVAWLAPLDIAEVTSEQGRRFERRVFSGDDEWGVLPDGAVWVARTYQNRVDWIDTIGDVRRGVSLPDRVLEVTRLDRERFVAQFPPELRASAERLPYSPIKPPFVRAFTGGDGHVWLEKSRWVRDSTQLHHEVGRDGRLIRVVSVPGWGRVVAATAEATIIAIPDSGRFAVVRVRR